MKKLMFVTLISALFLTGCSTTNEYQLYAEAQKAMAQSRAIAETAKYNALAEIAKTGDSAAKVAAVITLNLSSQNNQPQLQINPPKSWGETALQWTSILLPSVTQIYGINANKQIALTQSNNQAAISKSTNDTFTSIVASGNNANANIAGSGFTAVGNVVNSSNTAITSGFTTVGNVVNSSNTAITNLVNANRASVEAVAAQIQAPQANITNTTNIAGNNNAGANSGNTGRIVGGNLTESTATPTIVPTNTTNTTNSNNTTGPTTTTTTSNNTTGSTTPGSTTSGP